MNETGFSIDLGRMAVMSALMLLGILTHFVDKLAALEDAGAAIGPVKYLRQHPYRSLSMLMTCEILLFVFEEMGQLTVVTAIMTGFLCQYASERLRAAAESRIRPTEPRLPPGDTQ